MTAHLIDLFTVCNYRLFPHWHTGSTLFMYLLLFIYLFIYFVNCDGFYLGYILTIFRNIQPNTCQCFFTNLKDLCQVSQETWFVIPSYGIFVQEFHFKLKTFWFCWCSCDLTKDHADHRCYVVQYQPKDICTVSACYKLMLSILLCAWFRPMPNHLASIQGENFITVWFRSLMKKFRYNCKFLNIFGLKFSWSSL